MRAQASAAVCACLLLALSPAAALVRDITARRDCPTPVLLERAVSNATLYRQVYTWAHDKDVRDWSYEPWNASGEFQRLFGLSPADAAGMECAAVHYAASIRLPEAFVAFMTFWRLSVDIPLVVDKQVCRSDRLVLESAVIREPVLDEIRMSTRHELISDWDVDTSSHMQMRLPWYARLLEPQIAEALDRSVGEKLDAVMASMCDSPAFPALLRLQRPNASFVRAASDYEPSFLPQAVVADASAADVASVRRRMKTRTKMTLRRTHPASVPELVSLDTWVAGPGEAST